MISAFKHIRLSGYNLTPIQSAAWDNSSTLRLGFGNSGLAYYSELTGISGYLKGLINAADADVNSVNNLSGNIYITGGDGITIDVNSSLGEIKVVGNSGYFQTLSNNISSNLELTGRNLYNLFATFTGSSSADISAISGQIAQTGSILNSRIDSLSGYVTGQNYLIRTDLASTGRFLDDKINSLSGYADATYVTKNSQQAFFKNLTPTNLDAYAVMYPVPFLTTPKIQATLEVDPNSDVMYNLSVRNVGLEGYTGILSDNILEPGARIHTFASTQN